MDHLQEGSSKQDRTSFLKDQVSKIYMNTIAANEREDRLLSKRLDAIDMEHRAQYLRMRKIIRDATAFSRRRFPALLSGRPTLESKTLDISNRGHTAPAKGLSLSTNWQRTDAMPEDNMDRDTHVSKTENKIASCQLIDAKPVGQGNEQRQGKELVERLKYTEQEVLRIRKSFAGQNTPPVRKRTFLPHLEMRPEIPVSSVDIRSNPTTQTVPIGANSNSPANVKERKDAVLPEISKKSTPTNIQRRKTLAGTNASLLRSMKRESTAFSRSLPSSF